MTEAELQKIEKRFPQGSVVEAAGPFGGGSGDYGTVEHVDDIGLVWVDWLAVPESRTLDGCEQRDIIPIQESKLFIADCGDEPGTMPLIVKLEEEGVPTETIGGIVVAAYLSDAGLARDVAREMGLRD